MLLSVPSAMGLTGCRFCDVAMGLTGLLPGADVAMGLADLVFPDQQFGNA